MPAQIKFSITPSSKRLVLTVGSFAGTCLLLDIRLTAHVTELCCCWLLRYSIEGTTLTTHRHLNVKTAEVIVRSTGLTCNLCIIAIFRMIRVTIINLKEIFSAAKNVESSH